MRGLSRSATGNGKQYTCLVWVSAVVLLWIVYGVGKFMHQDMHMLDQGVEVFGFKGSDRHDVSEQEVFRAGLRTVQGKVGMETVNRHRSGAQMMMVHDVDMEKEGCTNRYPDAATTFRCLGSRRSVCVKSALQGISSVVCSFEVDGDRTPRFCEYSGLYMDFSKQKFVLGDSHRKMEPGFMGLDCRLNITEDDWKKLDGQQEEHTRFYDGLVIRDPGDLDFDLVCDYTITDPVFLMNHDQPQNMFHSMSRGTALFETIAVSGIDPSTAYMMELSLGYTCENGLDWKKRPVKSPSCAGLNFELYETWFKGVLRAESLREMHGDRICFSKIVPISPNSIQAVWGRFDEPMENPTTCPNAILRSMVTYTLERMGLPWSKHSKDELVFTYVIRNKDRKIENRNEFIRMLKELRGIARLNVVDLGTLSFIQQIKLMTQTDFLVATHGAGMAMTMFMPPKAGVMEIHPKYGRGSKTTMQHLVLKSDHRYYEWRNNDDANHISSSSFKKDEDAYSTVVDIGAVRNILQTAIDDRLSTMQ